MNITKIALILMATASGLKATSVIDGAPDIESGITRGADVIDIQTDRSRGMFAAAWGDYSVAVGTNNFTVDQFSVAVGHGNFLIGPSIAFGNSNRVTDQSEVAIWGSDNVAHDNVREGLVVGLQNFVMGRPFMTEFGWDLGWARRNILVGVGNDAAGTESSALGRSNSVYGDSSFAAGHNIEVGGLGASAFGSGITNMIAGSTMIGPSDTAKVTILPSGNVGIGTTAPAAKLHVVGDVNVTGSIISPATGTTGSGATARLRVGGTTDPVSTWQGAAVLGADGQNKIVAGYLGSLGGAVVGAYDSALTAWGDLNLAGSNLVFRTGDTERMRISAAGNVGVGTANPSVKLDVAGEVQIAGDMKVKNRAVIRVSPAGDIGMGAFTSGTNPEL